MISFNGCLLSLNRVVLNPNHRSRPRAEITAIRESSAAQENLKMAVQLMISARSQPICSARYVLNAVPAPPSYCRSASLPARTAAPHCVGKCDGS